MTDSDWGVAWGVVGPFAVFLLLLFIFVSVLTHPVGVPGFKGNPEEDVEYVCRLSRPGFHLMAYDCKLVGGQDE